MGSIQNTKDSSRTFASINLQALPSRVVHHHNLRSLPVGGILLLSLNYLFLFKVLLPIYLLINLS
jgi:hypothetical protein